MPAAVAAAHDAITAAVDMVVAALGRGGRLVHVGAGTPGRLGVLDAAECPPTFGVPPDRVVGLIAGGPDAVTRAVEGAEDDAAAGARDVDALGVGADDVVVGISASGRTPYVLAALGRARERGAATVGVANNPGTPLAGAADVAIEVLTGPEAVAGSTRMKAGTAHKLVLTTISTAAMVRLGATYGTLMVDVVATNDKLAHRAVRIVAEATGDPDAAAVLAAADGEVKTAIVMARTGVDAVRARERLAAAGGRVRDAVGGVGPTADEAPAAPTRRPLP